MENSDELKQRNKKRSKSFQDGLTMPATTKRRVNITITAKYWDKLDELGVTNKSSLIEDYIRYYIEEGEKEAKRQAS